jgi:tetratricopeptide (TPR) repeat protein
MKEESSPQLENLIRRGQVYCRRGEYRAAIEAFSAAIDLAPTDPELYYQRGNALVATERYTEAIADFSQAIALRPDYADAYHNRATAYADVGDLDAALADYTQAIQLNPSDPDPVNGRAAIYSRQKNFAAAPSGFTSIGRMLTRLSISTKPRLPIIPTPCGLTPSMSGRICTGLCRMKPWASSAKPSMI